MFKGGSATFSSGDTLPSGLIIPSPTITGTVTASQVTGIEIIVVAKWGVPVGLASSGTMGNNGAVSAMTAFGATYDGGIWLYYPPGAVAAGVPAAPAFLWTVMSSTSAGTVFNSTWDGLGIPPLGTQTAYATTGPGAFTGVATGEIVVATVTIAAGALGPNGSIVAHYTANNNTAAGNKILRVRYSGAAGNTALAATQSTSQAGQGFARVANGGVANRQKATGYIQNGVNAVNGSIPSYSSVDTTAGTTFIFSLEKATATNWVIWEDVTVRLVYGA